MSSNKVINLLERRKNRTKNFKRTIPHIDFSLFDPDEVVKKNEEWSDMGQPYADFYGVGDGFYIWLNEQIEAGLLKPKVEEN